MKTIIQTIMLLLNLLITRVMGQVIRNKQYQAKEQIDGVFIVESDQLVRLHSLMWLSPIKHLPLAFAVPLGNCIIVGENFRQFSPEVRDFIIMHELGHIKLCHVFTEKSSAQVQVKRGRNIKRGVYDHRELEADAFAVSVLGKDKSLVGIAGTRDLFSNYPLTVKELDYRIQQIDLIDDVRL